MSNRRISDVDERLLSILSKDARKSVVAMAKIVGLSRTAVQARLARLEDEGVIAGYTIILGQSLPRPKAKALMFVKAARTNVITNLKDLPESVAVWAVAGETSDGILLVDVADCEALGDLRVRLEHMPGLVSVTTVPILKTILEKRIGPHLCC